MLKLRKLIPYYFCSILSLPAAEITWSPATTVSADSDVSTTGALVEAVNASSRTSLSNRTVNGVTFEGRDILPIDNLNLDFDPNAASGLEGTYEELLSDCDFGGGTDTAIEIGDGRLIPGTLYEVQIWFLDTRQETIDRIMTISDEGENADIVDLNGSLGQFAIGTFVANGTSQSLRLRSNGFTNVHLNAYQIRATQAIGVTTSLDENDETAADGTGISLREAIREVTASADVNTILFDPSLAGSTITLTEGELQLSSSMTIQGLGADQLTVSANRESRIFREVGNGRRNITINDLTLADGLPVSGSAGVLFANGANFTFNRVVMTNNEGRNNATTIEIGFGTLVINDCAIVNNLGGGIGTIRFQDCRTTITNTTISGNGSRGISYFSANQSVDDFLRLTNVTITENNGDGIEIVGNAGTMVFEYQNTIFSNSNNRRSIQARGNVLEGVSIFSLGGNVLDDIPTGGASHNAGPSDLRDTDPLLEPLANNGGPTPTHALASDSPAINIGLNGAFSDIDTSDQRGPGFPRVVNFLIDAGAFEAENNISLDPLDDRDGDGLVLALELALGTEPNAPDFGSERLFGVAQNSKLLPTLTFGRGLNPIPETIVIVERSSTLQADSFEEVYRFEFDSESSTPDINITEEVTDDKFIITDVFSESGKAFYRLGVSF